MAIAMSLVMSLVQTIARLGFAPNLAAREDFFTLIHKGQRRELSAFTVGYLLHLLEEETIVMPAIWHHCTDDEPAAGPAR
jgi:hypothetical protein